MSTITTGRERKSRYATTYLTSEEYHKYAVIEEMTDSGYYSPEVCLAVFEAIENLHGQETNHNNGQPFDTEYQNELLQEFAEYSVGSWYDEDLYKMSAEADEYSTQAIEKGFIQLDDSLTIADMIRGALVVLIMEMANRELSAEESAEESTEE